MEKLLTTYYTDADNNAYETYDAIFDEHEAEISETAILTCIRNLNRI